LRNVPTAINVDLNAEENMLKRTLLTTMLLSATTSIWSAPSRYPIELDDYSSSSAVKDGSIRLRVSVADGTGIRERSVRVGNVIVCSSSTCYKAASKGSIDLQDTSRATAAIVADAVLPVTTITDLYFSDVTGGSRVGGHLKLRSPLILEKGFHGAELLVVLSKRTVSKNTLYVPEQVASSYFNQGSHLVRYVPRIPTIATLPMGATLSIPSGALARPAIFSVAVHDVGEAYPMVDIYPELKLQKAATLHASMIRVPPATTGASAQIVAIEESAHDQQVRVDAAPDMVRRRAFSFSNTGLIEPSQFESSSRDER
jgi:hypothetical protein